MKDFYIEKDRAGSHIFYKGTWWVSTSRMYSLGIKDLDELIHRLNNQKNEPLEITHVAIPRIGGFIWFYHAYNSVLFDMNFDRSNVPKKIGEYILTPMRESNLSQDQLYKLLEISKTDRKLSSTMYIELKKRR